VTGGYAGGVTRAVVITGASGGVGRRCAVEFARRGDRTTDFGAHGEFDDCAHAHDPQVWASHHHGALAFTSAAVAAGAAALWRRLR
jgi:NAD(P)-dependent dehydrogenase (short-subunit alcohol dehydrogenase family)